ncbi:MAG: hypothetical protein HOJ29_01465, partial [Candidatus Magasanikbacteria bacterium]|nr:hypothetical protein [Candidatus Magasanikbacteria bacterium]
MRIRILLFCAILFTALSFFPAPSYAALESDGVIYNELNYPNPVDKGLIWLPEHAVNTGGTYPVFVLIHGKLQPDRHKLRYLGRGAQPMDKTIKPVIASGDIPPTIIISPMDWAGYLEGSFSVNPRMRGHTNVPFTVAELLDHAERIIQTHKPNVSIDRDQVIIAGHSNGAGSLDTAGVYGAVKHNNGIIYKGVGILDGGISKGRAEILLANMSNFSSVVAIGSRNIGGSNQWIQSIMGPSASDYDNCAALRLYSKCKVHNSKPFYYFQTKTTGEHDATLQYFVKHGLPLIFGDGGSVGSPSKNVREEINDILSQPKTVIGIPGLEFTGIDDLRQAVQENNGQFFIIIPFIGEYIEAVYRYALAAASVVAIIMMIVAGLQWMTSAGSSDGIQKAKARMTKAVIGLLIAMGSYLILYTINPELIKFRNLRIQYVEEIPLPTFVLDGEYESQSGEFGPSSTYDSSVLPNDGVPHFGQCDPKWAEQAWGRVNGCTSGKNNICSSGCGITSLSMVLTSYRDKVADPYKDKTQPPHIADWTEKNKYRGIGPGSPPGATCNGTSWKGMQAVSEEYGMKAKLLGSVTAATPYLEKKQPVVV